MQFPLKKVERGAAASFNFNPATMGKKRKSVATRLDEVDRTLYTSFCSAANSLSQLYTQTMNHQRVSFQSGERHALEKLYQWILRKQEDGSRVATIDIVSYLQNELEHGADEAPISPRLSFPHQQNQQSVSHFSNSGAALPGSPFAPGVFGGQGKNPVFSNALSSPVRRSLQHYHLTQSSSNPSNNNVHLSPRTTNDNNYPQQHQNRESNPTCSNDTAMDMHADSPDQDSVY